MKRIKLLLLLVLSFFTASSQLINRDGWSVWMGNMYLGHPRTGAITAGNSNTWLQLGKDSTNRSMLLPRVVNNGVIGTPANGMFQYNLTNGKVYYYSGGIWRPMLDSISGGLTNSNIGSGYRLAVPGTNNVKTLFAGYGIIKDSTSNANGITTKLDTATVFPVVRQFSWGINGNAGTTPGANYIGTSDAQSLYFKTKGILAGFLEHSDTIAPLWARGNNVRFLLGTHAGQNLIENNITGSNTIIGPFAGRFTRSTANTFIGFHTGLWHRNGGVNGGRNVVIGDWAMGVGVNAYDNTSAGVFSLNQCFDCVSSAAFGRDVYKSLVHGNGMAGIGAYAGLFLSTGIKAVNVTNGGSGYTTATVTISAPFFAPNGGQCSITATATATINAGVITAITVTDPGCGYLNQDYTFNELGVNFTFTKPTVTITGDGTGATATLEYISPEGNTNIGGLSGLYRRFSYYDTYLGSNAGTISRYRDSFNVYAGYGADVDAAIPLTTDIARSFAAGYNAKVTQSNQMVLGGTTQKRVDVYGNINLFNSGDPITIGTNTNRSWNFITNNQVRGRWDSAGPLVIGNSNVYVNSWKMIVGGGTAFFDTQNGFFFARSKSTFPGGFSPNIFEDSTDTATFRPTLQTISPLMNRGELHTYNFGKGRSAYNMGALNYNFYSSGNDSNYISLSMWGTLNTLNINGKNRVGVNIANPDAFFHVAGLSSVTPAIIDGHEDVTGELLNVQQSGSKKFAFHSNGSLEMADVSAPSTPASGYGRWYVRDDSARFKNDAGTEFTMGRATGGGTPSGSNKQVQYNNSGSFGGAAGLEVTNSNIPVRALSQATTDTVLQIKTVASQTGDPFNIVNQNNKRLFAINSSGFPQIYDGAGNTVANFRVNSGVGMEIFNTGGLGMESWGVVRLKGSSLPMVGKMAITNSGAYPTANHTVDVQGSFGAAINTTSTNLTLDDTHHTVIVTSGTPTITLPAAASGNSRRIYVIVNQTGSGVTISSYLDFTGAGNTTVAANSAIKIQSNGTNWYRIL